MSLSVLIGLLGHGHVKYPIRTTVCAAVKRPRAFSGKLVLMRGTVQLGPENLSFYADCKNVKGDHSIEIVYPEDVRDYKPSFRLQRDANLEKLEYYLNAPPVNPPKPKPGVGQMMPDLRYCTIDATIVGGKRRNSSGHSYRWSRRRRVWRCIYIPKHFRNPHLPIN